MKTLTLFFLMLFIKVNANAQCWETIGIFSIHSLGIKSDGSLWAWGNNLAGTLGDGTNVDKNYPILVDNTSIWTQVDAGSQQSFGIKSDGSLWGWGINNFGNLGDGTNINRNTPVSIGQTNDWKYISTGGDVGGIEGFSFGIKNNGSLWGWGYNNQGQLGDGTNTDKNAPTLISNSNWKDVFCGNNYTLAIKSDGTLWATGENYNAQLGIFTSASDTNIFVQVGIDTTWSSIAAGQTHSFGIKSDGSLWGWGNNGLGNLGDGTYVDKPTPTLISSDNWQSVSCGEDYTLAIKNDGSLWGTGDNYGYTLGNGTQMNLNTFTQIGLDYDWKIAIGTESTSGAIKNDGTLWMCGRNFEGQCGDGTNTQIPLWKHISQAGCQLSLADKDEKSIINVYPNPSTNRFSIDGLKFDNSILSLTDLQGKIANFKTEGNYVDLSGNSNGIYFLQIVSENKSQVLKLMKIEF